MPTFGWTITQASVAEDRHRQYSIIATGRLDIGIAGNGESDVRHPQLDSLPSADGNALRTNIESFDVRVRTIALEREHFFSRRTPDR